MTQTKIGLIGLINAEAKQDFWGCMQRLAAIGYQGVESPGQMLEGDHDLYFLKRLPPKKKVSQSWRGCA